MIDINYRKIVMGLGYNAIMGISAMMETGSTMIVLEWEFGKTGG